ncbi:MAG: Firmicu-CTERM sorting domain-containing protein [Lachnospiraceae bacterium]|nr:Firmicu-CTERM sorting domain-containing protein [Lachnospiraceae bacterium]
MKKRISWMMVWMLVCCLVFPMTTHAAEMGVSVNEIVGDQPEEGPADTADDVEADVPEDIPTDQPADALTDTPDGVVDTPETDVTVSGNEPGGNHAGGSAAGGNNAEENDDEVTDTEKEETGDGSLAVDGYYDDWEGIPETLISYGSHNSSGTINEYHGAAMIVTDNHVYVHVRMSDLYKSQIPVDELKLTINGVEKSFVIRGRDSQNNINWNTNVYGLAEGSHDGLGIFYRDGGSVALGEAVLTIREGNPNDSFEFRMNVEELEKLYGLPAGTIGNGAKLEFYSPNIGPEKVTVVGTPTGAYIGIAFGFVIALAAAFGINKRKQA